MSGREKKKKTGGHLFVPSCGTKSLTEAILYDIGESLQSEALQGVKGRKQEETEMRRDADRPRPGPGHTSPTAEHLTCFVCGGDSPCPGRACWWSAGR